MKMKRGVLTVLAVLVAGTVALGSTLRPALEQEKAEWGATHVATITYADFTTTNLATAVDLTNVVVGAAGELWEFRGMLLRTAFDAQSTTTSSVSLYVGDGSTSNFYMEATEIAADGTEVFTAGPRASAGALTQTTGTVVTNCPLTATQTITYVTGFTPTFGSFDGTNAVLSITTNTSTLVITNATTALTGTFLKTDTLATTTYGWKYFSAAGSVYITFCPGAQNCMDDFTSGEVDLLWRRLKK
jgi:hypothetical protein